MKLSAENSKQTEQFVGPLKWMAPESIFEHSYSIKSDVFSFAVVLYEIISQESPWKDVGPMQAVRNVLNGIRMAIPRNCPASIKKLMEKCWAQNPEERPNFQRICDYLDKLDDAGGSLYDFEL